MRLTKLIPFLFLIFTFSCGGGKYDHLPLEKRYWTAEDFKEVVFDLKYKSNPDEKLPTFDDPESRIVLEKLVDPQNYLVVLDDTELGIQYRNEVAEEFFDRWREMNKIYWQMDRQDKYVYPLELVECFKFGLGLQLKYFQLGNEAMLQNSVNPNSSDLRRTMNNNIKTLIGNYGIYLDAVKKEEAFSEQAIIAYSEGIEKYFIELINQYPNSNYSGLKSKLDLLNQRSSSARISQAIEEVSNLIESKKAKAEG